MGMFPDLLAELQRRKQMQEQAAIMQPTQQGPLPNPPPATNESVMYPQMQPPQIPQQEQQSQYSPNVQAAVGQPQNPAQYAQAGPAQSPAYADLQKFQSENQRPLEGDYHPSKKRRVAAAILGGFAGLGGARQGVETADTVLNSPYRQQVHDYESKLADKEKAYKEESEQDKSRVVAREKAAKTEEELAKAKKELSEADYKKWLLTPEGIAAKKKAEHIPQPKDGVMTLTNGETVHGTRSFDSEGNPVYKTAKGIMIGPDALKDFKGKEDAVGSPQEQLVRAVSSNDNTAVTNITKAMELAAKANGTFGANQGREGMYNNLAELDNIRKALQQKELDNRDPKVTEALSKAVDANPQSLYSFDQKTQEDIRALRAKNGQAVPNKLGPNDLKRRETASITKDLVSKLRKQLSDPEIASRIGLFAGKYDEKSRQWVGTNPGNDPRTIEKAQNLRTTLTQLFNLEIQNISGGTSKQGLQDRMKELQGRQMDDMSVLNGVLSAADEYAHIAENNVKKIEGTSGTSKEDKMRKMLEALQ